MGPQHSNRDMKPRKLPHQFDYKGAPTMTSVLDHLVEHDMSDDCLVCRAQEVVAIALMPAAAAWEVDNGLPRFAVALNGAAELLGALLQDGLAREAVEAALSGLLDEIELRIAEDGALGGPPQGTA